ncbi:MAG: ATP-binding protein [Polyangiales bacterium]
MIAPSPIEVRWLPRLRWAAVLALLAAIAATKYLLHAPFPIEPMIAVVVALVLVNVALLVRLRRSEALSERAVTVNLLIDTAALTVLLVWTGGAMNPFTTLYLLQVALAAVLLKRWASLTVAVVSVLCFGALLVARPEAIHVWHSATMFDLHVRGMWVAFALTAAALWFFIGRVSMALRARERALTEARSTAELTALRAERLAAVATLAAGAAHELNTPLGTVMILASELRDTLRDNPEAQTALRSMRDELARCKTILHRMRPVDESETTVERIALSPWLIEAVERWKKSRTFDAVIVRDSLGASATKASSVALEMALTGLLDNARRAHADGSVDRPVEVVATVRDQHCWITVLDHAGTMSDEVASRAGEPFFTTREPGEGMGLGLYVSRSTVERVGGRLVIERAPGETRVSLVLPSVE